MEPQILIVLVILAVTVVLIVTEVVRIDLVAIAAMLALAGTGIISGDEARSGFASNAVLAVVAVMIMGRGLHTTGVTRRIADFIVRIAPKGRRRVVSTVGLTVGSISGFMQNIGAAALFLPVMPDIARRENLSVSSLLMPMGFAALLGGALTMVGTSSLIVLNSLMVNAGREPFELFAVTPVGIALVLSGVVYFFALGPLVFPDGKEETADESVAEESPIAPEDNEETESTVQMLLAIASFGFAIALVAVFDAPLSLGFMAGAMAMVLGGIMSIDEAYRAVEWKVVFLIAGLIPIGIAMENSGAAAMIAESLMAVLQGGHPYVILLAVGVLMTGFSLTMSNVGATVLMVPLVLQMADIGGLDARVLVLQVGICAGNSFLIPTHHVNALLMEPGGYEVADYVRAGWGLSVLFVVVSTTVLYVVY